MFKRFIKSFALRLLAYAAPVQGVKFEGVVLVFEREGHYAAVGEFGGFKTTAYTLGGSTPAGSLRAIANRLDTLAKPSA
jgi:hypothetical protein